MVRRARIHSLMHAGICLLFGTGCESTVDPRIGLDCQHVDVQISAGPIPTFSWTPSCRMGQLEVVHWSTSEYAWYLRSDSMIPSGVRYGVRPPTVEQTVSATPLVAGDSYFVRVGRLRVGVSPAEYDDVGVEFFLP
jgi:hypothetical protein